MAKLVSHPLSIPHRIGETETIDVDVVIAEPRKRRLGLAMTVVRPCTIVRCRMQIEVECIDSQDGAAVLSGKLRATRCVGPENHPVTRFAFRRGARLVTITHARDAAEVGVTLH